MRTEYKFRNGDLLSVSYTDSIRIDSYELKEGERWVTNGNGEHYVVNGNGDVVIGMGGKVKNVSRDKWNRAEWADDDDTLTMKKEINGTEWEFLIENTGDEYEVSAVGKINGKTKYHNGDYCADLDTAKAEAKKLEREIQNSKRTITEDELEDLPKGTTIYFMRKWEKYGDTNEKAEVLTKGDNDKWKSETDDWNFNKYNVMENATSAYIVKDKDKFKKALKEFQNKWEDYDVYATDVMSGKSIIGFEQGELERLNAKKRKTTQDKALIARYEGKLAKKQELTDDWQEIVNEHFQ